MNTVNQVGIYNISLAEIGVSRFIQSLNDQTEQVRVCNVFWESVRDQCLADFDWNFAKKQDNLMLLSKVTWGWLYTYAYPADCLAAREIIRNCGNPLVSANALGYPGFGLVQGFGGIRGQIPFETVSNEAEGGLAVATNEPNARLRYTSRILAYTLWSPAFVNCLALLLASKIVGPLANNPKYASDLGKAYEVALLKAGASSMNEQKEKPAPESELITTRG